MDFPVSGPKVVTYWRLGKWLIFILLAMIIFLNPGKDRDERNFTPLRLSPLFLYFSLLPRFSSENGYKSFLQSCLKTHCSRT